MNEDEKQPGEKNQDNSFKKGNINFDILESEEDLVSSEDKTSTISFEAGKRGIFDQKKVKNKITIFHIFLWALFLLFSTAGLFYILFYSQSIFNLLVLPLALLIFLWSGIMLVLIKIRLR